MPCTPTTDRVVHDCIRAFMPTPMKPCNVEVHSRLLQPQVKDQGIPCPVARFGHRRRASLDDLHVLSFPFPGQDYIMGTWVFRVVERESRQELELVRDILRGRDAIV